MKLSIWSEFLPYTELARPSTLELLARYQVHPCIHVTRARLEPDLIRLLRACEHHGLRCTLWPLLDREEGYWPSERNHLAFQALLEQLVAFTLDAGLAIHRIAFDLELPLEQASRLKNARGLGLLPSLVSTAYRNLDREAYQQAHAHYGELVSWLQRQGIAVMCAALDVVTEDQVIGTPTIQDILETPVFGIPWDTVSLMAYNTLNAQIFKTTLADARWMQYEIACALSQRIGAAAGMSLGLTDTGILGDEAHYSSPEELVPDVAAARAAGLAEITLYNLEGVLKSREPGAWLEVLTGTSAAVPPRTGWAAGERKRRQRLARAAERLGRWLRRA